MKEKIKNKENKILTIIIAILIVMIIGLCIYIAYDKNIIFKSNTKVEEKNKKIKKETTVNESLTENTRKKGDKFYFIPSNKIPNVSLGLQINPDKRSVKLTLNWKNLSMRFEDNSNRTDIEKKTITFNKEVKQVMEGGVTQEYSPFILYLMEDGTVEYTPINKAVKENDYRSYGPLPNVNDVKRLINVNACVTGCAVDTVALKSDGTIYDLTEIFYQLMS